MRLYLLLVSKGECIKRENYLVLYKHWFYLSDVTLYQPQGLVVVQLFLFKFMWSVGNKSNLKSVINIYAEGHIKNFLPMPKLLVKLVSSSVKEEAIYTKSFNIDNIDTFLILLPLAVYFSSATCPCHQRLSNQKI